VVRDKAGLHVRRRDGFNFFSAPCVDVGEAAGQPW
jgi:hypothetical protein